ncbi:hypothetical protein NMG60_11031064 [Bertholletia excelsa]
MQAGCDPSFCIFRFIAFVPVNSFEILFRSSPHGCEAARTARESLDLVFNMSKILETGLDCHTLSLLIALCDLGLNPESLAAVVKELQREPPSSPMVTASDRR